MTQARFSPPAPLPLPSRADSELFGTLLVEVVTPDGGSAAPLLADWEVRAWPVARLGDMTLEARPRRKHLGPADLDTDLRRLGFLPLGPFRAAPARLTANFP